MSHASVTTPNDALLTPFLQATNDEAERLLDVIISREAMPIISRLVRSVRLETKFIRTRLETSDVEHDIVLRLISHLHNLREDPLRRPILNFHHYVAKTSKNVCNTLHRRNNPNWINLKNRLSYFLTTSGKFDVWNSAEDSDVEQRALLCGLRDWHSRQPHTGEIDSHELLQRIASDLAASRHPISDPQRLPMEDLVPRIFEYVKAPLALNKTVTLVASIWNAGDADYMEVDSAFNGSLELAPDHQPGVINEYEDRQLLLRLWFEVMKLPLPQRQALMLSMRTPHGRDALVLFTHTNTATPEEVAAAIGMSIEELEELGDSLPMKDVEIAKRIGVTRQRVINLRMSARKRLGRWMESANKEQQPKVEGNHFAQKAS